MWGHREIVYIVMCDTLNIYRNCIGRNGGKMFLQKQGGAIGWKSILATWSEDLLSDYNLRHEYGKIILQMPKIWIFAFWMEIFLWKNTFFCVKITKISKNDNFKLSVRTKFWISWKLFWSKPKGSTPLGAAQKFLWSELKSRYHCFW